MNPDKIKAIMERLPPTNHKQIQEFLGLPGYYRPYIKDFSKITQPMSSLLKKGIIFNWDKTCQLSFEELKKRVASYPILRQPDFTKKFILHCDSNGFALGVILAQYEHESANVFAFDYVVAYGSRLLQGAEINYGITQ